MCHRKRERREMRKIYLESDKNSGILFCLLFHHLLTQQTEFFIRSAASAFVAVVQLLLLFSCLFFFFIYFYYLEANYFTTLQWVLSYIDMNQPWSYMLFSCCSTHCDPMDSSMPGFPVLHYFLDFAQTYVHWVSDAIQPYHPLLPSSLAISLSQHQGLLQWVSSSYQGAKVLELQLQHQSFHEYSGLISFMID